MAPSKPKQTPDGDDALVTSSLPVRQGLSEADEENNPVGLPLLLLLTAFSTEAASTNTCNQTPLLVSAD